VCYGRFDSTNLIYDLVSALSLPASAGFVSSESTSHVNVGLTVGYSRAIVVRYYDNDGLKFSPSPADTFNSARPLRVLVKNEYVDAMVFSNPLTKAESRDRASRDPDHYPVHFARNPML